MKPVVNWEELPINLVPRDLKRIMRCGTNAAYNLCHKPGFPAVRIGKKIIIPKEALKKWLESATK